MDHLKLISWSVDLERFHYMYLLCGYIESCYKVNVLMTTAACKSVCSSSPQFSQTIPSTSFMAVYSVRNPCNSTLKADVLDWYVHVCMGIACCNVWPRGEGGLIGLYFILSFNLHQKNLVICHTGKKSNVFKKVQLQPH